ncbi:MAG: ABC transporter substrate-binding protein [Chloroflexota bacterium]
MKRLGLWISLLMIVSMLAACGTPEPTATPEAAAPTATIVPIKDTPVPATAVPTKAAEGVPQGGTVVIMGHQEVSGLSPDNTGPTVEWVMVANIHNALFELSPEMVLEPVLAESYEVAEDGLTYTFKLRKGVKFHDGTEFTAKDVKYTYDYYRDEANATTIAGNFLGVDSVETPDDYTVIVHMAEVNAAFMNNGATTFIVQSEYHKEVGEDVYKTAPIGTGAFKVKEWKPAEYTLLEAFDDHFRGRPNIDFLREDIVPEPSVRTIALETGEAHSAVWPLLVEDSLRLAKDPNFVAFRTSWSSIKHFPLNNSLPQLSDKRVRQAMMYALDRPQIIADIWSGAASVAHTNLSPKYAYYYNSNVKQYEYDPEKAMALLDEAGWVDSDGDGVRDKDGVDLAFTVTVITGDQARRPIAEVAQQYLAAVGVKIEIEEAPVASILQALRECTMDASLFNWTYGDLDPDPFATLHKDGGNNFTCLDNARMNELIEQGVQVVDPAKRKPIYDEIQEIFAEEVPVLYIMVDDGYNIFSAKVKGLPDPAKTLTGDEIYRTAWQWWLED